VSRAASAAVWLGLAGVVVETGKVREGRVRVEVLPHGEVEFIQQPVARRVQKDPAQPQQTDELSVAPLQLQEEAEVSKFSAATQDSTEPFFMGSWNGQSNNWYGDVGISFVPLKNFTIVALGRHHHEQAGTKKTVAVTLWSVETQMALAIASVGPDSFLEGHYRFEPIEAPGVTVTEGREYRLTQACTPQMADKWFDGVISHGELAANAATGSARFIGGVNMSGFGYPANTDGQLRRAGMVNFKMMSDPVKLVQDSGSCLSTTILVAALSAALSMTTPAAIMF